MNGPVSSVRSAMYLAHRGSLIGSPAPGAGPARPCSVPPVPPMMQRCAFGSGAPARRACSSWRTPSISSAMPPPTPVWPGREQAAVGVHRELAAGGGRRRRGTRGPPRRAGETEALQAIAMHAGVGVVDLGEVGVLRAPARGLVGAVAGALQPSTPRSASWPGSSGRRSRRSRRCGPRRRWCAGGLSRWSSRRRRRRRRASGHSRAWIGSVTIFEPRTFSTVRSLVAVHRVGVQLRPVAQRDADRGHLLRRWSRTRYM